MPEFAEANQPDILTRLFGLEGQVAVVAGGAGRIGRTLCRALAEAGARVCVLDHNRQAAAELAGALCDMGRTSDLPTSWGKPPVGHALSEVYPTTMFIAADVTQPEQLSAAVDQIKRELGPPTILINASQFRGAGFYSSSVDDYPLAAWNEVLSVNLTGVFLTCQVFGRAMAEHGGGTIVNLASTYGIVSPDPRIYGDSGVNSPVSYAASKAGVVQLTRYLAVHWRERNIRVNCLVPGGVFDNQSDEFVQNYSQRTPLARMARAEDYQGAVLFMASPASAYMTGAVLTVDGGWTAW